MQQYNDDIFELYLDPTTDYQIKLRLKNFTPPASGNIDMTSMTADEAQLTIRAALATGFTELKLTGELSKIGMGGNWGTFINNKQITKCDLTGVTGWGTTPTLPELAFVNCTALQEVTLPDDVRVIGSSAFFGCAALTTVNLSQVTWINLNAFYECTSLEMLILDNVTEIGRETFYGCTSLKTLKIPKCTRFGNYIVTGCKALTRIEATATGDFADLSGDDVGIERTAVFHNSDSHSGDSAFNPAKCDLVLNADYVDLSVIDIDLGFTRIKGAEIFQCVNPFFVVFLTPFIMWLFGALKKKDKEPSTPMKIAIGMGIAALAYVFLMIFSFTLPAKDALSTMSAAEINAIRVTPWIMIGLYFILTVAELFISPLGLSFVSKVAPPHLQGLMQGCWLAATAVGNSLLFVGGILYTTVPIWACWLVFVGATGASMIVMLSMVKWLERVAK